MTKPSGKEKLPLKLRLLKEGKLLGMLVAYLFPLLAAFTTYKRMVLSEHGIAYFHYGYALIESLVLAKVILVGRVFHLGEKFTHKPLIVPTLHKALAFSLLALVFTLGEHMVGKVLKGQTWSGALSEVARAEKGQILAQFVVMFVAFIPMFAIWEASRVLGGQRLMALFFKWRPGDAA